MKDRVIGPMPVEDFLNKFLPNLKNYDPLDFTSASNAGVFDMQSIRKEEDTYEPVVDSLTADSHHMTIRSQIIICGHQYADKKNCSSFTFSVKLDVCVYADAILHGCNISKVEVHIEFNGMMPTMHLSNILELINTLYLRQQRASIHWVK